MIKQHTRLVAAGTTTCIKAYGIFTHNISQNYGTESDQLADSLYTMLMKGSTKIIAIQHDGDLLVLPLEHARLSRHCLHRPLRPAVVAREDLGSGWKEVP